MEYIHAKLLPGSGSATRKYQPCAWSGRNVKFSCLNCSKWEWLGRLLALFAAPQKIALSDHHSGSRNVESETSALPQSNLCSQRARCGLMGTAVQLQRSGARRATVGGAAPGP